MKKIFITVILLFLFCTGIVFAKNAKNELPVLKFSGAKFSLYYSAKSSELGGYINEYYKQNESYASWTELVAIHHYPNSFYPIEHAKEFKSYLAESGVPSFLEIDDEDNSAILDFIIIDNKKLPIIMEFNVFKYVKSPVCGTIAFQYAKRSRIYNALEVENFKKSFVKCRAKYVKKIGKIKVPDLVEKDIENGKYLAKEKVEEESVSKE